MDIEVIDRIEAEFLAASGKRYVILATSANPNNQPFYVGGYTQGARGRSD